MHKRRLPSQASHRPESGGSTVALSRRIALSALTAVTAVIATLAMPATMAAAADPISGTAGPSLTNPTDTHRVVLSWTPSVASVPYATGYELQISPNADWTNDTVTLPNGGITSNTAYEVPISLPHGWYYWRVRAVDAGGHSNWSAVNQFLREWDDAMTLVQEPTGSDPTIRWAPVPGASLYEVRYSVKANFPSDASLTATCWTAGTSFTPYTLQSTTETVGGDCMAATDIKDGLALYWEVRAWDDSVAPILPADTANDANFECATVQPECDASTLNSAALFANATIGSPTFTYGAPTAGTPAPSPVTGLTTTWESFASPPSRVLASHTCDDTSANICPVTPRFSWDPISGANYYEVTIYRDPALSNVYRDYVTQWPSITPRDAYLDAQVNDGSGAAFYWTVTADTCANSVTDATCGSPVLTGGGSGGGGSTTPTITFVGSSGVASFDKRSQSLTLSSPANNSFTNSSTGTFKWTDFFDAGGRSAFDVRNYRLQIATDADFSNVVLDVATIDMPQYTPQVADLADGDYYWRVQPVDESGNGLTWSNVRHFTRDATPPVFRLTDGTNLPLVGAKFHLTVSETDLVGSVSNSTVQIVPVVGGGAALPGSWVAGATSGTWIFSTTAKLVPGQFYGIHLNAGITDQAGNAAKANSHSGRASVVADDKSGVWSFNSGAARHSASGAIGGTYVVLPSARAGAVHFVGGKYYVYGCKGPSYAKLVVALDGHTITTVNEHQSFTKCGVLLYTGSTTSTVVHTLKLTASGGAATIDEAKTV
jgi:hypothetical protein